jgi:hypothetical protein
MSMQKGSAAVTPHPGYVRWMARLAILTLTLQLASFGHWSFGPFHPGAQSPGTHAAHCHGDNSACGGQPSFAGTYIEQPLTVTIPKTSHEVSLEAGPPPRGLNLPIPERPPKSV